MKKFLIILGMILLIGFSSAQLGIFGGNKNRDVINLQSANASSGGGGGGNVTSVTSSTNCITVNPTTGNVVITFNTSCSVASTDTWWRINNTGLINNSGYLDLNYTTINETIRIKINEINNSAIYTTHNQTYFNFIQNLTAYTCGSNLVVDGINTNGTVICVADANSGGVISNSSLNASYLNLSGTNANQNINVGIYNITAGWFKGLFNWIIGANPSQRYLAFNGSTLDFNETALNNTIINLRSVANATTLHCSNVTGNGLCPTSNATFNNVSLTGTIQARNIKTTSSGNLTIKIGDPSGNNSNTAGLVAIGFDAGTNNNGTETVLLGGRTGMNNIGDYLTAFGALAGESNTGDYSTLFGYLAGYRNLGDYAVFIGGTAGQDNSGSNNVGIGINTLKSNSGSNVIAFGYEAGLSNTVSNLLIFKQSFINPIPLIWGDFSGGNVAIGVTEGVSLTDKLTVNGSIKATSLNVTRDVCITAGKCLNQTITLSSNPAFNNTMIYWSNDTKSWNIFPESPSNNEAPVYCSTGSIRRWQFIDKDSGACPL